MNVATDGNAIGNELIAAAAKDLGVTVAIVEKLVMLNVLHEFIPWWPNPNAVSIPAVISDDTISTSAVSIESAAEEPIVEESVKGWVYLVDMGDVVKIGHTVNVEDRMSNLQGGCSATIELLALIKGNKRLERRLHKKFKDFRVRGEFFRPEIIDMFMAIYPQSTVRYPSNWYRTNNAGVSSVSKEIRKKVEHSLNMARGIRRTAKDFELKISIVKRIDETLLARRKRDADLGRPLKIKT